jgi:hypothetical protein
MATSSQGFLMCPYWRPWWNGGDAWLLALDVSDAASPRAVSTLKLDLNNAWGFSKAQTANRLVYFTHEQTDWSAANTPRLSEWLDVVDYADPTTPAIRPPVSVPGSLAAISEDGLMLYFVGTVTVLEGWSAKTSETLSACSYDGVSAYLVASLGLQQTWPRPFVVNRGRVFLGRPAADEAAGGSLELWTLSGGGRFQRGAVTHLSQAASALAVFNDLVAVQQTGNGISIFDVSSGEAFSPAGEGTTPGCLWADLNRAAADPVGFWIPLDEYGVAVVPLARH